MLQECTAWLGSGLGLGSGRAAGVHPSLCLTLSLNLTPTLRLTRSAPPRTGWRSLATGSRSRRRSTTRARSASRRCKKASSCSRCSAATSTTPLACAPGSGGGSGARSARHPRSDANREFYGTIRLQCRGKFNVRLLLPPLLIWTSISFEVQHTTHDLRATDGADSAQWPRAVAACSGREPRAVAVGHELVACFQENELRFSCPFFTPAVAVAKG